MAPDRVEVHFNLGRTYLESGRAEPALAHFQRVISLAPAVAEGPFTWKKPLKSFRNRLYFSPVFSLTCLPSWLGYRGHR